MIYFVLNFNSLIRKNDFWIEKRNNVLDMNLKGKNAITFICEKSSVAELNLQIVKYLTGLDGEIIPKSNTLNREEIEILILDH